MIPLAYFLAAVAFVAVVGLIVVYAVCAHHNVHAQLHAERRLTSVLTDRLRVTRHAFDLVRDQYAPPAAPISVPVSHAYDTAPSPVAATGEDAQDPIEDAILEVAGSGTPLSHELRAYAARRLREHDGEKDTVAAEIRDGLGDDALTNAYPDI